MPSAVYRYPIIAREGWMYIILVGGAALLAQYYVGTAPAFWLWLVALGLIYLFRDPHRRVPASPLGVVSPVDGLVLSVGEAFDPWLDRSALRGRIGMRPQGVFSVRSPVEGKVSEQWLPGRGERSPRRGYAQWIRTDEGDDIVLAIEPALVMRRPFCYVEPGQRVGQGQRCGYIPFGTRLEVFLPQGTRIAVEPGQKVLSGTDIVASLIHK